MTGELLLQSDGLRSGTEDLMLQSDGRASGNARLRLQSDAVGVGSGVPGLRKECVRLAAVTVIAGSDGVRLPDEGVCPQITQITQMENEGLGISEWAGFSTVAGRPNPNLCNLWINLPTVDPKRRRAGALQIWLL